MILIPRGEGVDTKPIKTAYSAVAGTAYVTFDKVRVPIGNTLGEEGAGLSVILSNFNHERWMVTATSQSAQRVIVEECLKYVLSHIFYLHQDFTDYAKMDKSTNCFWQTTACSSCHTCQACQHDISC